MNIHKLHYLVTLVAVMATFVAGPAPADDQPLIAVLQSDAPKAEKALTCKQLAVHGTAAAVPLLADLLKDPELASWARIALEAIPHPAADTALRDALEQVDGRLLVGVINSIGVRGDEQSVDPLSERLGNDDPQVASAAAIALGTIGNAQATAALSTALATAPADVRSAIAEACVLCAERLLAAADREAAAELYNQVRTAHVPKQRVVEATRGAILARQVDGIPLLVEQLQSEDKVMFALGLSTSRELQIPEAAAALGSVLQSAPPARQAGLLMALADRRDAATLPAVLQLARNGSHQARIAALGVLNKVGDVSCVPFLLELAGADDLELASAAKVALEELPGDAVDADLVARLDQPADASRGLVIEMVGLRRIDAVPALVKAAEEDDSQIRAAAMLALGATVGPDNLEFLIQRVISPPQRQDREVCSQALHRAATRMPDREACAEQIAASLDSASLPAQIALLETLGAVGGERSLAALAAAAKGEEPGLQDNATRLLGHWMTLDAGPVLLDLAQTAPANKYRVRSLRGYIRIARQFTMSQDDRVAMCRTAWETATRDDERKLVLQVLRRYPSVGTLRLAVAAAQLPSVESDATDTAVSIVKQLAGDDVDAHQLLAQIGDGDIKVEITEAEYGADTTYVDVTEQVRQHVGGVPWITLPSASYSDTFGSDPVPGVAKELKIKYRINGKPGQAAFPEDSVILLPIPE